MTKTVHAIFHGGAQVAQLNVTTESNNSSSPRRSSEIYRRMSSRFLWSSDDLQRLTQRHELASYSE